MLIGQTGCGRILIMNTVYIEQEIKDHPRVAQIIQRLKQVKNIIYCNHYGEIFNSKGQNFRLQKQQPALILARKIKRLVLPTPEGLGIGGAHNYYFSHMLNCLYDCRYCFLQGMYSSANYVLFINYEDFIQEIRETVYNTQQPCYFFSGYDADSLVFDDLSGFTKEFLPVFSELPNAFLELRTKSINIKSLLAQDVVKNVVVAFSFTPQEISQQVEHGVPSVAKRIHAMQRLASHGYLIGLRFDPLIYTTNFTVLYQQLIDAIFTQVDSKAIHSVTVGAMRFPKAMYQKLVKLYPEDKLLAHPLEKRGGYYSYNEQVEQQMKRYVQHGVENYIGEGKLFSCSDLGLVGSE